MRAMCTFIRFIKIYLQSRNAQHLKRERDHYRRLWRLNVICNKQKIQFAVTGTFNDLHKYNVMVPDQAEELISCFACTQVRCDLFSSMF